MSDRATPNKVLTIMSLPDKAAVEKFCRDSIVSEQELAEVIWAALSGDAAPYQYRNHFDFNLPNHLTTNEPLLDEQTGQLSVKTARKLGEAYRVHREFRAHLFFASKEDWHLFCFDQRDTQRLKNHWKGGSHLHYSRASFLNIGFEAVWAQLRAKPPKTPSSVYVPFAVRAPVVFTGQGDT